MSSFLLLQSSRLFLIVAFFFNCFCYKDLYGRTEPLNNGNKVANELLKDGKIGQNSSTQINGKIGQNSSGEINGTSTDVTMASAEQFDTLNLVLIGVGVGVLLLLVVNVILIVLLSRRLKKVRGYSKKAIRHSNKEVPKKSRANLCIKTSDFPQIRRIRNDSFEKMSDNPQIQVRHLGELNVSDDDWLRVFAFIGPAELGLKLALLSARFDGLVDLHFKSRKWTLGDFEIRRSLDGGGAEIVKEYEDGTSDHLPLPQGPLPANVVGFICILISFIDGNVVSFLNRIRRLFNVELTLELNASFNEYSDWITLITDIWPLLAPNVHRLLTFDDNLYQLRKLVSPTVLRDCAKLRAFHSVDLLPKGPADDRDRAYNEQALFKWLHSPRGDGRLNIFECLDWLETPELVMEELKQTFLKATSPANYAIVLRSLHFDSDVDFEQFELVNGQTREKLALRRVRDDIWMMKRGPSAGDEEQWAALEREAVEEWERNNLVVIEIGGDVESASDQGENTE
uniref:Uncharacterized protein n=1 Tax=Globodera rostochiensis TaxID=31243 RepID=A0A914GY09_GLORO